MVYHGLSMGHEESEEDRAFSLLGRFIHSDDCSLGLASVFEPLMDFTHPNIFKARILHLSED